MFDLRKLLGTIGNEAAKAGGAVGKALQGGAAGGAQQVINEPRRLPMEMMKPMQPMQHIQRAPMSLDNQITNQMVGQGQLPAWQQEVRPQQPLWQQGNFGPQAHPQVQEDDGMVWGPQGIQPLNQIQQGQPWENASGPFRPRY